MSRKYKFHNPSAAYFVSFATLNFIEVSINYQEREARASVGVDLDKFSKYTLEGPELNISGSYKFLAGTLIFGLKSSPNGGYKTGQGPYHGFTVGAGYGTPFSVLSTISDSKLIDNEKPLFQREELSKKLKF